MSGMTSIAAEIKARAVEEALANAPVSGAPWGYVTALDPLAVRLDGANLTPAGPVPNDPIYPDTIVSGLRIGDRVQVLLAGQRATIIGTSGGGDTGWLPITLTAGHEAFDSDNIPMWREIAGVFYFKGAIARISGTFPDAATEVGVCVGYADGPTPISMVSMLAADIGLHPVRGHVNRDGIIFFRPTAAGTRPTYAALAGLSGKAR